ncbi:RING finger protein 17 [Sander lucioperca]|uniref:Ring finger protein 17 n=1 Tax=Sander lucioperca TaxID=283035 RepID=A0A8C9Y711_SANLU|nr:RING finger protein 17 [Sander lucioperca]XP_031169990.1 RING finger protein 17 [Sander lucioperca]
MMDRGDNPSAVTCTLCGEAYTLPEDEVDGNLPRALLCAHIYCTSCLLSIQCDSVIRCPECEVESNLPEGGVFGLQEDSRIIGLIYTSKMNKMKRYEMLKNRKRNKLSPSTDNNANTKHVEQPADIKDIERAVDEALVRAAENHALLDHIHESLTTGLAEQVKRERARLEIAIKQAADKALHAIQNWRDEQLIQLPKLEEQFSTSRAEVCCVQERIKALDIAMQMAREVRRVPFLEQYCTLDKVLETLHAPVDNESFDMKCITMDSGMSCVFLSEGGNQSLSLSLMMEFSNPKNLSESLPTDVQHGNSNRKSPWQSAKGSNRNCILPSRNKLPTPQNQDQESPGANSALSRGSSPSPTPRRRPNLSCHNSASDHETPDVIVEELLIEEQENALPPTGPELANDKWRIQRRRKNVMLSNKRNGTQWVVVSHIVNPNHFYIRYLAEKRDSEILSMKIQYFCNQRSSYFTSSHMVETGSMIFAKCKKDHWCRASVAEVLRKGCVEAVKVCPATELASIRVFFLDYGFCKILTIQSEEGNTESALKAVNNCLRKVDELVNVELQNVVPQAIRCSLKDLIPYDLTKGWGKEAQVEFQSVVGSAAVEMRPLGQDRDSLLVDLRKSPMDQSSDVPISVREFLVFIEVARFYSPVKLGRRPLQYYPRDYPKFNTELNAVVSHINNPSDFYIQLVDNMESMLLSVKLQECYNATSVAGEDDLNIYCPVIEQACVARYDDKLWYRALVIGHPGGRKVEVQYVDFGNKDILSVSDLRKIKDEFFALPSMAIHCSLSDVIPLDGKTWSDACCNRFISLAHQKPVTVVATGTVPKTEPLPVKLFESSLNGPLANIAELLVKEELASFKEGLEYKYARLPGDESAIWDPPLELGNTCGVDASDQKNPGQQSEELLEVQSQLKLPDQLKDLKVTVSHVNSPSSFYVQLSQYKSQLKRMCELVKDTCAHMEPQDVVWKSDMSCAAHINGVWERGQICSDVTSSNIAEVMRCDHGNTVKLDISCLRPLPLSLTGSLALECTLTDIRPAGGRATWTATACDIFANYLTGASAVMTIKELTDERPVPVTLFCPNRMGQLVNIADFLASEGLALKERKPRDAVIQKSKETDPKSAVSETKTGGSDGENKNTPPMPLISLPSPSSLVSTPAIPRPSPRTIMSAQKVQTQLYQPPELPCLSHIQITVTAIGEDGLIYTRTQNAEYQLEQLRERIQQSMKTLPKQKPYTWKSVLGCSVIGPDMLWYRGQLLEVLGGHVKVQYVDYGLVESIPVVHVYPRLLCDDIPQLCMPCQLHSINPIGGKWQQDALALLREVLLDRSVDMQVMELPTDPRGPLKVMLFLDRLSLSRILCHHEHASIDRTVSTQEDTEMSPALLLDDWDINTEGLEDPEVLGPFIYPNLPQEGERFQVTVKHLLTPNKLFLWPLEGEADVEVDGETLEKALARINENRYGLQRLTNFCQGYPCLAEYSDGKYYRAKLIEFASIEPLMLLVQHVDFGSDDTLPTSKLRQMPAKLLRFPSRALKVKVAGFKSPSVNINKNEKVLPYSPGWTVKAAYEMIDMLHGQITASVVARDPKLTVLLYNEKEELVHLPLVSSGLAEFE